MNSTPRPAGQDRDAPGKRNNSYLPDALAHSSYHIISNHLDDLGEADNLTVIEMALLRAL